MTRARVDSGRVPQLTTGPLLLASASPRRRELLERIGLAVEVHPADVDERAQDGESPEAYVARIARAKAIAVARRSDLWVLAADTTVTLENAILGKAESPEEAAKMLRWLSGRTHQVLTGFIVIGERDDKTIIREGIVSTDVTMIDLDGAVLADYVASGEWRGKAGAYAIQGIGAALVRSVHGSVTNVIGLPVAEVIAALREVGGPLPRLSAGVPA
ncbi:MAG TPA: nucleoside triphosphate pyrophosphatase [Kofleriaceae bacterium]|nr:nucleoside triphosphate pyrophosphatase [Kofleriaceae bacterium]